MARKLVVDKRALFRRLGYEPHDAQWPIHDSTAPRRVVACGARFGKTMAAAWEATAAALQPCEMSRGWVVGPIYELCEKVFRELVVIAREKLAHRVITLRNSPGEKLLVLRNLGGGLSEIRGKSADNETSLLGEGLDWMVCDEAARLKPRVWQAHLSQRLIDKKGWALLISTPKGKGWFYDMYRRGQGDDPDYRSWNLPSWANPHLDRDLIEAERLRLPAAVFAEAYEARFVEGAGAVFRNVRECATIEEWESPRPDTTYWAGLDLAKVEDYTVLTIVASEPLRVVRVERFHKIDWQAQISRVVGVLARFDNPVVTVDTTGVGDPIHEALCTAGVAADGITLTNATKANIINNLVLMLEQREIRLPSPRLCPELVDELEAFQYSITDHGNVRMNAPGGSHDDCVISLALACWAAKTCPNDFRIIFI